MAPDKLIKGFGNRIRETLQDFQPQDVPDELNKFRFAIFIDGFQ